MKEDYLQYRLFRFYGQILKVLCGNTLLLFCRDHECNSPPKLLSECAALGGDLDRS